MYRAVKTVLLMPRNSFQLKTSTAYRSVPLRCQPRHTEAVACPGFGDSRSETSSPFMGFLVCTLLTVSK